MKKVELVKGIHSSVLGFGCAPILGSVGGAKSARAIACALDNGINHFDIARSYGYGEAEKFVGRALKSQRDSVVIASKFGIKANFKAKLLSPVKPLIRYALSKKKQHAAQPLPAQEEIKPADNKNPAIADRFHYRIDINAAEMRKSLEQSLQALGTDYLDYFFVHEPYESIKNTDELFAAAELLKKEGKIRAFGLAYMQNQQHLHTAYIDKFDVLQFNNSPGLPTYKDTIDVRAQQPNIFFSPINNGGTNNLSPAEKLTTLSNDFPNTVILCSMFNEKHLASNAALFK